MVYSENTFVFRCTGIYMLFFYNKIVDAWDYRSFNKTYTLRYACTAEFRQINSIYTTRHDTTLFNTHLHSPFPWKTWCPGCTANKSCWINCMHYVGNRSQRHIYQLKCCVNIPKWFLRSNSPRKEMSPHGEREKICNTSGIRTSDFFSFSTWAHFLSRAVAPKVSCGIFA